MKVKCFKILMLCTVLTISMFVINAISFDNNYVSKLKQYEQNIVDYANGDDWMASTSVELGDAGAYDDSYVEPDYVEQSIEPKGLADSDNFSYYVDLESESYYQVYNTDNYVYFVQWSYNDLSKPRLIEYYKKQ